MSKISVIGAGNVGASCAEYIAIKNFAAEVVLLDIKENFAEGKALDLMQTAAAVCIKSKALPSAKFSLISN
ncbi:MAG: lactate/malate family dehydrogenase, partial [Bacteroidota bacterium]